MKYKIKRERFNWAELSILTLVAVVSIVGFLLAVISDDILLRTTLLTSLGLLFWAFGGQTTSLTYTEEYEVEMEKVKV